MEEINKTVELDSTSESEETSRREPEDDFWYKIMMIADGTDC